MSVTKEIAPKETLTEIESMLSCVCVCVISSGYRNSTCEAALGFLWCISIFLFFLRIQEQFQKNPDSYNGAIRENYIWSQDYTDLEVRVPVPKHVVKGKQVTAYGQGLPCSQSELLAKWLHLLSLAFASACEPLSPGLLSGDSQPCS